MRLTKEEGKCYFHLVAHLDFFLSYKNDEPESLCSCETDKGGRQIILYYFHLVAQLDFFLSNNNGVTRTLAHDSGYYCTLRVKKLGKIPRGLRPLGIFPRFFTLRVQ